VHLNNQYLLTLPAMVVQRKFQHKVKTELKDVSSSFRAAVSFHPQSSNRYDSGKGARRENPRLSCVACVSSDSLCRISNYQLRVQLCATGSSRDSRARL
jgi:hypothetical protein